MQLNTIRDYDFSGKRVVIRVDFNVPLKDGVVTDDTRIKSALPTINYLLDHGASLVVMTHLGRPKGKKNPEFSLKPVAKKFAEDLGRDVQLADDVIGPEVEAQVKALKPGQVLLRTTLRSQRSLPVTATCMSTTLSALHTGHMPPPRVSPITCRPMLAS